MTQFIISQEEKRNRQNWPLYSVRVVDRDAHAANQEHLLFTAAWQLAASAMQPGDTLTEMHASGEDVVTYEQVQDLKAKEAAFEQANRPQGNRT